MHMWGPGPLTQKDVGRSPIITTDAEQLIHPHMVRDLRTCLVPAAQLISANSS